jgi:rubrerythrin
MQATQVQVMSERHVRLHRIFKTAIDLGREEQKLYAEAAELCDDDELRRVLESFSMYEAGHQHFLLEKYKEYRDHFAKQAS